MEGEKQSIDEKLAAHYDELKARVDPHGSLRR